MERELQRFVTLKKIPESFSEDAKTAIDVITYDEKQVVFAGSSVFKSLRYSADIDLAEYFNKSYTAEDIGKALQTIVRRIQKQRGYYIADIKCGLDQRLNIFHNLGELKNNKIQGYDSGKTGQDIQAIKEMIAKDEYNELVHLNKVKTVSNWLELRAMIRKLMTLRWTPDEVLAGHRTVGDKEITLAEAVPMFLTKIDVWFDYDGVFTEITNVILSHVAEKLGLVFLPICPNENCVEEAIKYSLFEYLHSEKDHNYLKVLKRVWSLALVYNDKKMLELVAPILVGDIALLNKCVAIMSTLIDMLEKMPNPPMKEIHRNIDQLKTKLANIYQFPFGEAKIDDVLDSIKSSKTPTMIERLSFLKDDLTHIINEQTSKYIKANHIFPLPKQYLP